MLGRREKHLEYSVTSLLDRLWVEGEVHFKVDQEESLVNDLVVTEAVVVGVGIGRSQRDEDDGDIQYMAGTFRIFRNFKYSTFRQSLGFILQIKQNQPQPWI